MASPCFGDQKLYRLLTEVLYFDYVIRFRGNNALIGEQPVDLLGRVFRVRTWRTSTAPRSPSVPSVTAVSDASAAGCQGVCRMLSLITDHGRATPLVWLTVDKSTLKNHRSLLMVAWLSAVE